MPVRNPIVPLSLKEAPSLIERVLPVQKISAEAYKEQMAGTGKTLTALGSYWKGRKPLILNKACVLACLLPATDNPRRDLEVFEQLMAMDDESFAARWKRPISPKEILSTVFIPHIEDLFVVEPEGVLPASAPVDWSHPDYAGVRVAWRADVPELERRQLQAQVLPKASYREWVDRSLRPEEVTAVHDHVWDDVNSHLGTSARSIPVLVEQLGIMRFGHRPRFADTFCGSGQIAFEAARLGCDTYASDLNPVACMLTWGAFNIVGGPADARAQLELTQRRMVTVAEEEIRKLGVEDDGQGWRGKIYFYCTEVRCPATGWLVPMLPNRVLNRVRSIILELIPDPVLQRYDIAIRAGVTAEEMAAAREGTVRSEGRGQEPYLIHAVAGTEYRTKLSTIRGDYRSADRTAGNRLRMWEKGDFKPRDTDIFQERLYAIQWMRPRSTGRGEEYEVRAVTAEDLHREQIVEDFVGQHLAEWQAKGWIPDMRIESGDKTDEPIRTRGWTYWHHLFNPRQLLVGALLNQFGDARLKLGLARMLNANSRLSRFTIGGSGAAMVTGAFDNQALNTLINYGCRGMRYALDIADANYKSYPFEETVQTVVACHPAEQLRGLHDVLVTDPPYGDAVKYEEILEFFISWLRTNPPPEFAAWTWDSRRALAITGEDEAFRRSMVAAYTHMTDCMPENGIQVIMFTHQSGSLWADMANIVWASGLQVTAAWYVVTETDSALREGSYVKGTVLLVLRKRRGRLSTFRDELAMELVDEVEDQIDLLTGLNQRAGKSHRDENVFSDADLQMAGYAAALRVLTRYAEIDGIDMTVEALRPRTRGEATLVDELIEYAVEIANQALIPSGIPSHHWKNLENIERFYLKMLDLEAGGANTLDNYQNFAKAFKIRSSVPVMASERANAARLKSGAEFGRAEMTPGSELADTPLRGVLYALMEMGKDADPDEVLGHLADNVPDYLRKRDVIITIADYMASRLPSIRPNEASQARILRELVRNERLA